MRFWGARRKNGEGSSGKLALGTNADIEKVVGTLIDRISMGLEVDYEEIQREHGDLMPELAERLRRLQSLNSARCDAASQLRSSVAGKDGFAEAALTALKEVLDDYEILAQIHYGGQGAVYKAIQSSTRRTIALKLLLHGPLASEQERQRFAREIQLCSRLRHPNIVTLHECGEALGRPYFTMEFVEGVPISDYIVLHSLPVRAIVQLFVKVCRAVSCAHQHGIIHRDLKPTNILVDLDGQPRILDFGLAKDCTYDQDSRSDLFISMPGQVVGTLPYLSPEQARGTGDDVDVRSDIYALGIVLFEMLTGRFPYSIEGGVGAVRRNIISTEPIRIRTALSEESYDGHLDARAIDEDLEAIVRKTLEKDRSYRYQSAPALADDLDRYLAGEVVEARAHQRAYLLRKTFRKYRIQFALAAAFLLVLVAGLLGTTVMWQRAERISQIAQGGLIMAHYNKLGSAERDAGRIESAAELLKKAIEIGEHIATDDPVVCRYVYSAYHMIAEMYYEEGRHSEADPYCLAAIELAERMATDYPDDPEWERMLGFAYILQGKMVFHRKEFDKALSIYDKCAKIRAQLARDHADNDDLREDLAFVRSLQGRCHRKLKQFDESLRYYEESYELRRRLYAEQDTDDRAISLCWSELKLAVWDMSQKDRSHDTSAREWMDLTENRLLALKEDGRLGPRERDTDRLLQAIRKNRQIIEGRTF